MSGWYPRKDPAIPEIGVAPSLLVSIYSVESWLSRQNARFARVSTPP